MQMRHVWMAGCGALALLTAGCSQCGAPGAEKTASVATPGTALGTAQPVVAEEETGPIALVNGNPISRDEFNEMYEKMTKVYTRRNKPVPENVARRHKQNIVNRLIEKALIEQAIAKAKIEITPAELEEGLTKYKEMFRTEQNFERYLQSSNTTLEKIKENIQFNKALDKLLAKDGPVQVTDDQIKEYYEQNKTRYEVKEMIKASHILVRLKKDATEKEKAEALTKANQIYKEVSNPKADFAQLAIKYSEGPTGPKGGDLGFFAKGRMAPEFEQVAFGMKPGQISKPVLTQFGYHIIKVYETKPAGQKSIEEVKDSIFKLLESRENRKRKSDLLRDLKKDAAIVNNLKLPPMTKGAEDTDEGLPGELKLIPGAGGPMVTPPGGAALPPGITLPPKMAGPRQPTEPIAPPPAPSAPATPAAP